MMRPSASYSVSGMASGALRISSSLRPASAASRGMVTGSPETRSVCSGRSSEIRRPGARLTASVKRLANWRVSVSTADSIPSQAGLPDARDRRV
ncbi:hypothetical protein AQJ91_46240 [Streptomyces dysideae]|uniref:Uncharacterized protein n=1 Tax=Streptomyces dysideae TaxID=909626 RepID=A0A101UPI7_9ACTN|nr:hypothetical protein AQJ91_46240 [Streptomyces dysideae]